MGRLTTDAMSRPDLFHWNGALEWAWLLGWLRARGLEEHCPRELVAFWQETGGGDLFESETILGPRGDPEMGDDWDAVNRDFQSRGMQAHCLVFHVGMLVSAVDMRAGDFVELAPSDCHVLRRFTSLDVWYEETLRAEYAARYHLPLGKEGSQCC